MDTEIRRNIGEKLGLHELEMLIYGRSASVCLEYHHMIVMPPLVRNK